MTLRFLLSCLLFLCISGCSLLSPDDTSSYPTVLKPLPAVELERLQAEFDRINEGEMCTDLNQFGLTDRTEWDECPIPDSTATITDTARVRQMVKEVLVKNAKFTNVDTKSSIRFNDIGTMPSRAPGPNYTHWRVVVADQRYKGIPVLESPIFLWLTADGVYRIDGYWYDDIEIPAIDRYSPKEVKENLVGYKITGYGWGGAQSFTITRESIAEKVKKVIVPVKSDEKIELHVTWRIGITNRFGDHLFWFFYIDTTTGKRVEFRQLFMT